MWKLRRFQKKRRISLLKTKLLFLLGFFIVGITGVLYVYSAIGGILYLVNHWMSNGFEIRIFLLFILHEIVIFIAAAFLWLIGSLLMQHNK